MSYPQPRNSAAVFVEFTAGPSTGTSPSSFAVLPPAFRKPNIVMADLPSTPHALLTNACFHETLVDFHQ
ncbi:MAG: hypothetical protein P8J33_10230 [Pirellulaceae bacterium]|nr:hypothetical protein [Pirellulaceae bacterium]